MIAPSSAIRVLTRFAVAPFLTVLWSVAAAPAQDKAVKYPNVAQYDFRGTPVPDELTVFGDKEGQLFKPEKEGLRVTLPKNRDSFLAVGMRPTYPLQGDFEITTAFEILEAEEPEDGFGVGVNLRIEKVDSLDAASLARLARAKGAQVIAWGQATPKKDGQLKFDGAPIPCKSTLLRLRLKRAGTALHFLWAAGSSGGIFQEIHVAENFGREDVKPFGLSAMTGKQPCKLDVRFLSLEVHSGGAGLAVNAPVKDATDQPAPPKADGETKTAPRGWLMAASLIGGALVIVFGFVIAAWFVLRKRGDSEKLAEESAAKAKRPKK